jgi:hypothetical protein
MNPKKPKVTEPVVIAGDDIITGAGAVSLDHPGQPVSGNLPVRVYSGANPKQILASFIAQPCRPRRRLRRQRRRRPGHHHQLRPGCRRGAAGVQRTDARAVELLLRQLPRLVRQRRFLRERITLYKKRTASGGFLAR